MEKDGEVSPSSGTAIAVRAAQDIIKAATELLTKNVSGTPPRKRKAAAKTANASPSRKVPPKKKASVKKAKAAARGPKKPTWKEQGAPGCAKCRHVGCRTCFEKMTKKNNI